MTSDQEAIDLIELAESQLGRGSMPTVRKSLLQAQKKITDLMRIRNSLGECLERETNMWSLFIHLLALEIGKLHKLTAKEISSEIIPDGTIIITSGKNDSFKLDFSSVNKELEYLLCMVRLIGIEDGYAVAVGTKSQTQVYYGIENSD